LYSGNVSPLPRGRRALPRRQEPGRCRDATATARTFRTEPRTSNCSRSAPNDVSRRERAEPRSASTARGITFEKRRNTRVWSGYWCPYTGMRESNDRFRGGGGCVPPPTRGSPRRRRSRSTARMVPKSIAGMCERGGPDGGKARERAKCVACVTLGRFARSTSSPNLQTLGGAILGAPQADDVDDTGKLSNSLVVKNKPLRLEVLYDDTGW